MAASVTTSTCTWSEGESSGPATHARWAEPGSSNTRVHFTTATPGLSEAGSAYRMDKVPLSMRAGLRTLQATDEDILDKIRHAVALHHATV